MDFHIDWEVNSVLSGRMEVDNWTSVFRLGQWAKFHNKSLHEAQKGLLSQELPNSGPHFCSHLSPSSVTLPSPPELHCTWGPLSTTTCEQIQCNCHFNYLSPCWILISLRAEIDHVSEELPFYASPKQQKRDSIYFFQDRIHPSISWFCTSSSFWLSLSFLNFSTWLGDMVAPHLLSGPFLLLC